MPFSNTDPHLVALGSQLLQLQRQLINAPPKDIQLGGFIAALEEFINQIGDEIQKQAL